MFFKCKSFITNISRDKIGLATIESSSNPLRRNCQKSISVEEFTLFEIESITGEKIDYFKSEKQFTLDKAPLNFICIGFIKILFPDAKIIHCNRNLEATALSIYKNSFEDSID